MNPELDTLATRLYVTIDDALIDHPEWLPERPAVGIAPKLSDAELVTLAVIQALLGFTSEAQFIRHAHAHLRPWFPYLPDRPGYNKRLRHSGQLLHHVIAYLARACPSFNDDLDLAEAQAAVTDWCRVRAGMRTHGTTGLRPIEVFVEHEAPVLAPAPAGRYDLPIYRDAKVARDHHIQIAKALYSVPGGLIGQTVAVRADSKLVKIYARGVLVKTHTRVPAGHRCTDAEDLPAERTAYALRDIDRLIADAGGHGDAVGAFAKVVLDHPLPWTKMRQVYKLLGLCRRYGDDRVDAACRRALDAETDSVTVIGRMLERALEAEATADDPVPDNVIRGRFARSDDHFAVTPTGVTR